MTTPPTSQPRAASPAAAADVVGPPRAAEERRKARPVGGRPSSFLTVVMLLCVAYFLLPLWWVVVASTKSNADLFSSFGLWFADDFRLVQNLQDVFTSQNGVFLKWLRNSAFYAVVSAVGAAVLATMAGYAFAKIRFPGRTLLFSIVLGAIMIPMTALAIPTYLLFTKVNLVNTPWAVILPSLVSPFGVYLMRVYAEGAVDGSLLEAARVDGAGEFRIFVSVVLRLLAPGFVTVLLFQLVATWNNYFLPLIMLNDPDHYPITVGLSLWSAQAVGGAGSNPNLLALVVTGSLLSVVPLILAFIVLQRYWQSGLTAGSVTG